MKLSACCTQRILWCLWFALIASEPYAFGRYGHSAPDGPIALSGTFALVAAGVLVGAWIGSLPAVRRYLELSPRLVKVTLLFGFLTTLVLLVIPSWVNAIALMSLVAGDVYGETGHAYPLDDFFLVLVQQDRLFGVIGGCICGFVLPVVSPKADELVGVDGSPAVQKSGLPKEGGCLPMAKADGLVSPSNARGLVPACLLLFTLGFIRPIAWVLLLPHSPFPQPLLGSPMGSSQYWVGPHFLVMVVPAALLFLLVICLMLVRGRALPGIAALCFGELAFRAAGRVAPSLYAVGEGSAKIALCAYLVLLVVACLLQAIRLVRVGLVSAGPDPVSPAFHDVAWLRSGLSDEGRAKLLAFKLSEREILVVCATVRGCTSGEAARIIGISDTTVREYRRRIREKTKHASIEELVASLPGCASGTGKPSSESSVGGVPASGGKTVASWARALLLCSTPSCLALLVLPFDGAISAWSDVWTMPTGIAAGLIATMLALVLVEKIGQSARVMLSVLSPLSLAAGIALMLTVREGVDFLVPGYAPYKAVSITAYAACTFGLLTPLWSGFAHFAVPSPQVPASRVGFSPWMPASALAMAATVLLAVLVPGAWTALLSLAAIAVLAGCLCMIATLLHEAGCASSASLPFCSPGASPAAVSGVLKSASAATDAPEGVFAAAGTSERASAVTGAPARLGPLWAPAVAFIAWSVAETWRASTYLSLLPAVQWWALVLCLLVVVRFGLACRPRVPEVAGILAAALVGFCAAGVGGSTSCLALYLLTTADARPVPPAQQSRGGQRAWRPLPWHGPLFVAAFGLVAGCLMTNEYGTLIKRLGPSFQVTSVASDEVRMGACFLVSIFGLAAVLLCLLDCRHALLSRGVSWGPSPEERIRVLAFLMSRGLTQPQAEIAVTLASGSSMAEAAELHGYSISAVHHARREAYAALDVHTRDQFRAVLKAAIS